MYKIEVTRTAEKELSVFYKKDRKLYSRLINAIESLAEDPKQGKALKHSLKGYFSYRVGTYRIIYSFKQKKLLITIIDVGHRREIYR